MAKTYEVTIRGKISDLGDDYTIEDFENSLYLSVDLEEMTIDSRELEES